MVRDWLLRLGYLLKVQSKDVELKRMNHQSKKEGGRKGGIEGRKRGRKRGRKGGREDQTYPFVNA